MTQQETLHEVSRRDATSNGEDIEVVHRQHVQQRRCRKTRACRLSKDTSVPEPGRRTWTTGWAGSGKTSHDFLGEGSGTAGTCVLVTSTRRGLEAGPGKSAKSEAGPGTRPSRCPTARRPTGWPSAAGSNEPSRNPRRASWPHQGSQSSRPPR